ncbi:hypothetical protein HK104_009368, partial [Borealophlyctis nickersoniae]
MLHKQLEPQNQLNITHNKPEQNDPENEDDDDYDDDDEDDEEEDAHGNGMTAEQKEDYVARRLRDDIPPETKKLVAHLRVFAVSDTVKEEMVFPIRTGISLVGRSSTGNDTDVVLPAHGVSGLHALIEVSADGYEHFIEDLASTNGTTIGTAQFRITPFKMYQLTHGKELSFVPARCRYEFVDVPTVGFGDVEDVTEEIPVEGSVETTAGEARVVQVNQPGSVIPSSMAEGPSQPAIAAAAVPPPAATSLMPPPAAPIPSVPQTGAYTPTISVSLNVAPTQSVSPIIPTTQPVPDGVAPTQAFAADVAGTQMVEADIEPTLAPDSGTTATVSVSSGAPATAPTVPSETMPAGQRLLASDDEGDGEEDEETQQATDEKAVPDGAAAGPGIFTLITEDKAWDGETQPDGLGCNDFTDDEGENEEEQPHPATASTYTAPARPQPDPSRSKKTVQFHSPANNKGEGDGGESDTTEDFDDDVPNTEESISLVSQITRPAPPPAEHDDDADVMSSPQLIDDSREEDAPVVDEDKDAGGTGDVNVGVSGGGDARTEKVEVDESVQEDEPSQPIAVRRGRRIIEDEDTDEEDEGGVLATTVAGGASGNEDKKVGNEAVEEEKVVAPEPAKEATPVPEVQREPTPPPPTTAPAETTMRDRTNGAATKKDDKTGEPESSLDEAFFAAKKPVTTYGRRRGSARSKLVEQEPEDDKDENAAEPNGTSAPVIAAATPSTSTSSSRRSSAGKDTDVDIVEATPERRSARVVTGRKVAEAEKTNDEQVEEEGEEKEEKE